MISAYGPAAERYAALMTELMVAVDAIIVEPAHLSNGYVDAVRRRSAGESFYGMLILEDNRDRTMTMIAPSILNETPGEDFQRATFYGIGAGGVTINGKPGSEWLAELDLPDPVERMAAVEFLLLCPALLVRSMAEYKRVSALTKRARPYEVLVLEPPVPDVERHAPARPSIVLWAPQRDATAVAMYAFALSEIHGDVTMVTSDGILPIGATATAYQNGDLRITAALAAATCVVLADATDPGAAVAFARRGYGVVAPLSSGADEFVQNIQTYDPAHPRQIHVAALLAMSQSSSLRPLPSPPPRAPLRPVLPVTAAAAPPATIVIPTFNRRDDLGRCLAGVGAQTYPNVRAIVVNDAGERVDDVVARFPFAQLLHLEKNLGVTDACMAGLDLVADGFVKFLSDDDALYPDHVERMVTAMLRSGASLAHGNTLIRYVARKPDGSFATTGFSCGVFNDTATPSEAMVSTPITGQSILWRTSVFEAVGRWRSDSMLSDQEIQLRAGQRFAFAYVDQVTSEWRVHGDNFSGKVNAGAEQRRIYEVLHPTPDRPWLNKTRDHVLDEISKRPAGYVFEPSLRLTPDPEAQG